MLAWDMSRIITCDQLHHLCCVHALGGWTAQRSGRCTLQCIWLYMSA